MSGWRSGPMRRRTSSVLVKAIDEGLTGRLAGCGVAFRSELAGELHALFDKRRLDALSLDFLLQDLPQHFGLGLPPGLRQPLDKPPDFLILDVESHGISFP